MTRALVPIAAAMLCVGCQAPDPVQPGPTPPPPAPVIEGSPRYPSDRDALSQDRYVDLILAHGNLADLPALPGRATVAENVGATSARKITRLAHAIAIRARAACPELPSDDPDRHATFLMPLP